ncbi:MAG: thioredoxin family protein [Muribaculaceae bacterium]|nr:thioredoxin family protein [Muribaculaceae bacterium]
MDIEKMKSLMAKKGVVLVEFFATWCPHCQRMAPVVQDIEALVEGRASVVTFDIDKNQELAEELQVESLPTFLLYRDGREVWRATGEMDGNIIVEHIQEALAE